MGFVKLNVKKMRSLSICWIFLFLSIGIFAQNGSLSAREIIAKADQKVKGNTSAAQLKMTIQRPTWRREIIMKSWSKGDDFALILVTAPDRDKGTAFLKREREMWNWQPTIDRIIKLPPSMMLQSWMGSDFTNDDLVKQSSVVDDYEHKIIDNETIDGRDCYVIEMIPNEDAAVVWGKVMVWIDKKDFIQMKTTFYDEDQELVQTMFGKSIKMLGGQLLPSVLDVIPADKPGNKTEVEYLSLEFNLPMEEDFFSIQRLKRLK